MARAPTPNLTAEMRRFADLLRAEGVQARFSFAGRGGEPSSPRVKVRIDGGERIGRHVSLNVRRSPEQFVVVVDEYETDEDGVIEGPRELEKETARTIYEAEQIFAQLVAKYRGRKLGPVGERDERYRVPLPNPSVRKNPVKKPSSAYVLAGRVFPRYELKEIPVASRKSIDAIALALHQQGAGSVRSIRAKLLEALADVVRSQFTSAEEAQKYLLSIDRRLAIWGACACVRDAFHFVPANEKRPLRAIETTERWLAGEATTQEVREAAKAAHGIINKAASVAGPAAHYAAMAAGTVAAASVSAARAAYDSDIDRAATHAASASACSYATAVTISYDVRDWRSKCDVELRRLVSVIANALPSIPEDPGLPRSNPAARPIRAAKMIEAGFSEARPGGVYIRPEKGVAPRDSEILNGRVYTGGFVDVNGPRPALFVNDEPATIPGMVGQKLTRVAGRFQTKVNLYRQSAGWEWESGARPTSDVEGSPAIVSVESPKGHHYALRVEFETPVWLATYPKSKSEPRLRPTALPGVMVVGEPVGTMVTTEKEHPVYDVIKLREPAPRAPKTRRAKR